MFFKRSLLNSTAAYAGAFIMAMGLSQSSLYANEDAADHAKAKPHIDLAFCIDTTGSMRGEIEAVKTKTREIVAKLGGSKPTPVIRVGLVAYRDRGDQYVTKVFQFSENIDQVVKDISSLNADGGGDEEESVNQALHTSVNDLAWSKDKKTVKLLFLIGDAGPHFYPGDYSWEKESKSAIAQGIQINTIACNGLKPEGLDVFQKIAKLSDGKCDFLTYRQEIVNEDGHRTTVVSSAGKMYKVETKSAEAWREGADKLVAKGAARAFTPGDGAATSYPAPGFAAYRLSKTSSRSALPTPMAGAYAMPVPPSAPSAHSAPSFAGGSISRGDSNLADIVLDAAKSAAKKKAGVEFKD